MIDKIKTQMSEHLFDETMAQLELSSRYRLRAEIMHPLAEQVWDNNGAPLHQELKSYR